MNLVENYKIQVNSKADLKHISGNGTKLHLRNKLIGQTQTAKH